MQVKRYHAHNVQDALRAVRRDLGPDALVLSTQLVAARGPRGWFGRRDVELTAAASRTEVPEIRPPATGSGEETWPDPPSALLAQRLTTAAAPVGSRGRARRNPVARRRAAVLRALTRLAAGDRGHAPIEVFVGAPGAGKTTVTAAIAARARVRTGMRFGLVSVTTRAAASGHDLATYAGVIGASLATVGSAYELQTVLETATVPVLVDVDSHGRAVHDVLRLVAARADARVHLVIAADAAAASMRDACESFAPARPTRAVITRIDLADSVEAAAAVVTEQRLAVSHLCAGPRIPEDLVPMTASARLPAMEAVMRRIQEGESSCAR